MLSISVPGTPAQEPSPPIERPTECEVKDAVKRIKAHIAKGDAAKEKSEQHYIAAGVLLKAMKDQFRGTSNDWDECLKAHIGIGKSRAAELIAIGDGRKTVAEVLAATNARKIKHRAALRSGTEKEAEGKGADQALRSGTENVKTEGNGVDAVTSATVRMEQYTKIDAEDDGEAPATKPTDAAGEALEPMAPIGNNPLCDAWARASAEERAEFTRRHADELRRLVDDHQDDDGDDLPRLGDVVAGAFEGLQELASECREVVDNAPDGLNQTQRIQTLDETAGVLEELNEPAVPATLAEIKVKLHKQRRPRSRGDRRDIALDNIAVCIEALTGIGENDPRHKDASDLRAELESTQSEAEMVEFPGMFG